MRTRRRRKGRNRERTGRLQQKPPSQCVTSCPDPVPGFSRLPLWSKAGEEPGPQAPQSERRSWAVEATPGPPPPGPPPPHADLLTAQGTRRARPEPARSSCRPHRARDWAVWKWALWIPCLGVRGREEQNWIQPSHGGCCPCVCAHVCAQCARGQVGSSTLMHQTQVPHFCAKCLPWSLRTSFPDALARPSECRASAGPGAFAAAAGVSVSPSADIQPRGAGVRAAPGAVLSCFVPTCVAEAAGQALPPAESREGESQI